MKKPNYTKKATGHHKIHGKMRKTKAPSPSNLQAPQFEDMSTYKNRADQDLGKLVKKQ